MENINEILEHAGWKLDRKKARLSPSEASTTLFYIELQNAKAVARMRDCRPDTIHKQMGNVEYKTGTNNMTAALLKLIKDGALMPLVFVLCLSAVFPAPRARNVKGAPKTPVVQMVRGRVEA